MWPCKSATTLQILLPFYSIVAAVICSAVFCFDLSDKERELIPQLRKLVQNVTYKDYMTRDEFLVRFLRATNNDLVIAQRRVQKTITWRKENQIDNILLENFTDIESQYPFVLDGADNHGRPISIGKAGDTDLRKLVLAGKYTKVFRLAIASLELVDAILREMQMDNINVTQFFWISDQAGYNAKQHACVQCTKFFPQLYAVYENHYPEIISKLISINTPNSFTPTFTLFKALLSSNTLKRVEIFGGNRDQWRRALLKEASRDQLPMAYGGSKSDAKFLTLSQHIETNPYAKRLVERAKLELNNNTEIQLSDDSVD